MTITLELTPEEESHVQARARAHGVDVAQYTRLCLGIGQHSTREPLSNAEFEAALDALAEGSENRPAPAAHVFSREHIYGDHD